MASSVPSVWQYAICTFAAFNLLAGVQILHSGQSRLWCKILYYFFPAMILHYGDMSDSSSLVKIIAEVKPVEIYNLAAQSHVKV